ncbi:type II/IV secretion system protein [Bradyrhizobium viridifuturi]|jgi:general secretion pathway protein E|uniref:GspE/PulE family protein n=1 Tax=Bradyrhizobium TaxID=374 RepID=UPI0003972DE3|nr:MULTISPECIES: GspE/PulE family protein [Bradyrhizobium]ERF81635.1 MAG: general secretion pathway protein E [Bradyrhizobium sp. DFCI-1]OYU62149.1 MAG: type II/IV secretion system protein [Bradyrhizobium sp. PARBB1]PSO18575.1 type II/IV secretion system protein [Bradyrhizobium sp. MOS004]QRI68964.1 type II/IV secretion system protein [Bradyrhizobium sp. PSBB068]MBR1022710.1 type II/IV secretion system protein [Bradyrhizobium viridifuturi]
MANDLSVRFVDYLRQNNHLAPIDGVVERTGPGADVRQLKLWEVTSLSPTEFADEAARFFALGRLALQDMTSAEPLVSAFSARFLRETMVYPCRAADGTTVLAVVDPTDQATLRAAQIVLGAGIDVKVASSEDVVIALNNASAEEAEATDTTSALPREDDIESLRDLASGAPVVRAVNDLIEKAVELRASDIHIEPFSAGLMVRLRIDGLLRPVAALSGVLPQAVVSRIKIIANLNIAERRLPQDGAARLRAGRTDIDIRVAIMPTQHGESAVIRILPKDRGLLVVEKLGFSAPDEGKLRRLLKLPHGMVVITGPTGSGKTTTLATILSILNEPSRKILTIEDPVEYELPGVNQSQIKPAIGLTFATALRSFVRQDPDVIMVGEIRDTETAHVAVHAALTGHLVLTTLHTETAAAAVPRLLDLGVEGYLLRSVLRGVIAQRLVRQLCERCKTARPLAAADFTEDPRLAALGFKAEEIIQEPCGCERCGGTGYRGRLGVFELLELSNELRELIGERTDGLKIDTMAIRAGMTTMLDDGVAKCRAGLTSPAEILRVATVR